jgi:hypothetical protein
MRGSWTDIPGRRGRIVRTGDLWLAGVLDAHRVLAYELVAYLPGWGHGLDWVPRAESTASGAPGGSDLDLGGCGWPGNMEHAVLGHRSSPIERQSARSPGLTSQAIAPHTFRLLEGVAEPADAGAVGFSIWQLRRLRMRQRLA